MLLDKDDLIRFLLERYYMIVLDYENKDIDDFERGYRKGIIDTIEEVNKFQGYMN